MCVITSKATTVTTHVSNNWSFVIHLILFFMLRVYDFSFIIIRLLKKNIYNLCNNNDLDYNCKYHAGGMIVIICQSATRPKVACETFTLLIFLLLALTSKNIMNEWHLLASLLHTLLKRLSDSTQNIGVMWDKMQVARDDNLDWVFYQTKVWWERRLIVFNWIQWIFWRNWGEI